MTLAALLEQLESLGPDKMESLLCDNLLGQDLDLPNAICLARCAMLKKQYTIADRRWKQALDIAPQNAMANAGLLNTYLARRQFDEIEHHIQSLDQNLLKKPMIANIWAKAAEARHDWQVAHKRYQLAANNTVLPPTPDKSDKILTKLKSVSNSSIVQPITTYVISDQQLTAKHFPAEEVFPTGLYTLENCSLNGKGFIVHDDKFITHSTLMQGYVDQRWKECGGGFPRCLSLPERHIKEDLIFFSTEGVKAYGHWLLDMLPKIFLLKRYFPGILQKSKLAIPEVTPNWALNFLSEVFDIPKSKLLVYNHFRERLIAKRAHLPTLLHKTYLFSEIMEQYVDFMLEKFNMPNYESGNGKLYISRRKTTSITKERNLINEKEIEHFAIEQGFNPVYNEELSWMEKISLYSRANIIAGPFGSGLHNSLFSPFHSHVISLRTQNGLQREIGRLRKQTLYDITPKDEEPTESGGTRFTIDIADFQLALDTIKENT